jgi:hypothetical protein
MLEAGSQGETGWSATRLSMSAVWQISGIQRCSDYILGDQVMRRRRLIQKFVFGSFILASSHAFAGTVLITEQEASLPAEKVVLGPRGITRGPRIDLVQPEDTASSPLHFQIQFHSFGGTKINPDSLRVTYLKNPEIDITPRVRSFAQAGGIDIPDAEIPAGEHYIRTEVTDTEGRIRSSVFVLKVAR